MHTRRQIIKNQKDFLYEIKKSLNKEFNNSKQELLNIETDDKEIIDAKNSLESKFKNVKIEKEINKFFINENNIYPKYYVWWDEINEKVEIFLYEIK
jgi:hypothetical protein